jgi:hypothetical protein
MIFPCKSKPVSTSTNFPSAGKLFVAVFPPPAKVAMLEKVSDI